MKLARIESLPACGMSYDSETHRIQPGLSAPPMVVGSIAALVDGVIRGALLDKRTALAQILALLENPAAIIIGANVVFDLLVAAVEHARMGVDILPLIFAAYADHRIYDIQNTEALSAVAEGYLGKDPRTGAPLVNPETGRRGRYALATVVDLQLGRKDAKVNDEWRQRYAELEHLPIPQWPEPARVYPVDDAVNTHEAALAQCGFVPSVGVHRWTTGGPGTLVTCTRCGVVPEMAQPTCVARARVRNLHDQANQNETHWGMYLGASYGFRVNQASVDAIERDRLRGREGADKPFIEAGLIRADGSQDLAATKRRVAAAYGAVDPCAVCRGTGKVNSPKAPLVRCKVCRGKPPVGPAGIPWCQACANTGKVPSKRPINCAVYEPGATAESEAVKIKTCDGTGYELPPDVPRSDKEGVGYGRDVLNESGDDLLIAFAAWDEDKKDLELYVPYLRKARACVDCGAAGTDDDPHRPTCPPRPPFLRRDYRDIPLTLWPNVILETGRVSYGGAIMLFKRQPGHVDKETGEYVPSLRECIEARPGHVLGSIDYEAGELITHAQSCIWITGDSQLARALLAGVKPHNALAATMIGMSYEQFQARVKERVCKDARQAAKPPNFGYPGGMGPPKLVLQQRVQGPDTPHPNGPHLIKDEAGNFVRGYKGLRFCILMDGASSCGDVKLREWYGRPIKPTCKACIDCAVRLKAIWLKQWPENTSYFEYINRCIEDGQLITQEMLDRWPHLREVYAPWTQLAPGEIMQHVSGRIRGVSTSEGRNALANGFFQGLLADAAKSALRRIVRECYDRTVRVASQFRWNSNVSAYAGGPSPLFGSRTIVFQHDEVLPEFPESVAHDAVIRTSEIMVEELRYYCPDLADAVRAEPALMRKWYKGAEMVKNSAGRIIPWEPKIAA